MNKIDINKQYHTKDGEYKLIEFRLDEECGNYVAFLQSIETKGYALCWDYEEDGVNGTQDSDTLVEINPMEELLEEAKRRGYKEGVRLRYPLGGEEIIKGDLFISDISGNVCFIGSEFVCWIYDKRMDRWAEIVEQPKEEHVWTENKQEQLDFVKAKVNKLESELLELRELINRIEK